MSLAAVFLGIDLGTQGVRVMALNEHGQLLASASSTFEFPHLRQEQPVDEWWRLVRENLSHVAEQLRSQDALRLVKALSVTSTSGTIIPLDDEYQPLHAAIMYSDDRSSHQALRCKEAASESASGVYKDFNTASGLSKICWFLDNYPDKAEKVSLWAHAADYIVGRLNGIWRISDFTSVLKTGYDLHNFLWPDFLQSKLALQREWFPDVVPSTTRLGRLSRAVAEETGLPLDVVVVAGMTDGCASQIAAGAVQLGSWNTTIGTTLVVKGVSRVKLDDPDGTFYNHRHPQGYWMPGGASNTGADWVRADYPEHELEQLNNAASRLAPTRLLNWPLRQQGERFPFVAPQAKGFGPLAVSPELRYTSGLEGVAYIERMAYDRVKDLTGQRPTRVYTAGGATRSRPWMQIRSNVLGVSIVTMKHTEAAVGAAIVAAAGTSFETLQDAAENMLKKQTQIDPDLRSVDFYEDAFQDFVAELRRQGYLEA